MMWGRWDLNPDQRVSSTRGATPRETNGSSLQLFITGSATISNHSQLTGAREDTVLPHTPTWSDLSLAHLLCPLPAPHLLLAPFPALLASFLPGAWTSLHLNHQISCPDSIGTYQCFPIGGPVGTFATEPGGSVDSNPRPLTCFSYRRARSRRPVLYPC